MAITTLPWDAADYLGDDEAIAAYLDAAFEEGDPKLVAAALGDIARAKGITDLAARTGLLRENLDRVLSGASDPEFSTIMKIVEVLGLRLAAHKAAARAA